MRDYFKEVSLDKVDVFTSHSTTGSKWKKFADQKD